MGPTQRILLTIGIVIVILAGFFLITNAITKYTGFSITPKQDSTSLKDCLKEKEISLYVNTNDLAETLRKLELIDYLAGVEIHNCLIDNSICLDKKIGSFPMWEINSELTDGDISKEELISLSGCIFAD